MTGVIRLVLALAAISTIGCGGEGPLSRWTPKPTPHERYAEALKSANLDGYALGRAWLAAADQALAQPEAVTLPFQEAGFLDPALPSAVGYRFDLRRGRVLEIDVKLEPVGAVAAPRLFLDLFLVGSAGADRVASADEGATTLRHVARRDGTYIIRLQPEVLAGGRYTITQRTEASLRFPVENGSDRNVQSVFGDPRDGGVRTHHGVDIFARRGTPVLAAADGIVRRVETTAIGGRVVWLTDAHGQSFYYAHLDDWATEEGRQVKAGDVLGMVGNTGNARSTPPHLHFGVYSRGPVDPLPFIRAADRLPAAPSGDLALVGQWGRVAQARADMRDTLSRDAGSPTPLGRHTALRIVAAAGRSYRVLLPDGREGYVEARAIGPLSSPLETRVLEKGERLLASPSGAGVLVAALREGARAAVLAEFEGFSLVEINGDHLTAVVSPTTASQVVSGTARRVWVREDT